MRWKKKIRPFARCKMIVTCQDDATSVYHKLQISSSVAGDVYIISRTFRKRFETLGTVSNQLISLIIELTSSLF